MTVTHTGRDRSGTFSTINLNAVTTATNGTAINTSDFKDKSVWINVSVNTGAVTVTIEASYNGTVWFLVRAKTYTGATAKDHFGYTDHFPFMRVTTSTQSNSTVTAVITGLSN